MSAHDEPERPSGNKSQAKPEGKSRRGRGESIAADAAARAAGDASAAVGAGPGLEERRTRALEEIAAAMTGMRGYLVDISLWLAHIGRNMPTGRPGRPEG